MAVTILYGNDPVLRCQNRTFRALYESLEQVIIQEKSEGLWLEKIMEGLYPANYGIGCDLKELIPDKKHLEVFVERIEKAIKSINHNLAEFNVGETLFSSEKEHFELEVKAIQENFVVFLSKLKGYLCRT